MESQPTQPRLKLLLLTLILVMASLLFLPLQQLSAQTCAAGEQVHVIASGETLFRIGLRYGVPMEVIAVRNNITNLARIFAGTTLCIPGGIPISSNQTIVQVIVITVTPSANTTTTTTNTTTTTTTTSTTVQSGEENWCLNGGPWDDGRCIVPGDPYLQDYWFLAGWCNAQVQLGNYMGSLDDCLNGVTGMNVSTTSFDFDLVDGDGDLACTVIYDKDTGIVTSLAEWDDDYEDQSQVIFFTNLPDLGSYSVDIGSSDESAGVTSHTLPHKTFSSASAKIRIDDGDDIGPTDCDRVET